MKLYKDQDVLSASIDRIKYIFSEFGNVSLSFSGGKDSSTMLQLCNIIAREINRKFNVLFIDLEADYELTISHIMELKNLSQINTFEHVCLPISVNNGVSIFNPTWICWDIVNKEKWIREMPKDCINEKSNKYPFFYHGITWYEFLDKYSDYNKGEDSKSVTLVGLRADESYHRFKAVAFGQNKYNNKNYIIDKGKGLYNAYPLYDYSVEDIWGCVFKFGFRYNKIYDLMTMSGLSVHEQRVSQPYGNDQKTGLKQWASLEPETWPRIVDRLSGTNMSALYCKTSLLGYNGSAKPDHLSWQQYSIFLLESLGLYDKNLMIHYYKKIKILFQYYNIRGVNTPSEIKDEMSKSEMENLADNGKWIHWKRIAICIEKNDFACRSLTYGITDEDKKDMVKLKDKWGKLLGMEHYKTKEMRTLANEIGYEL